MIDYVIGGEYLNVTSSKGAQPYINMSSTQPMLGSISYDPGSQQMKVYDGNGWMTIGGGSATVNLSPTAIIIAVGAPTAISILRWAEKKMQEEYELQRLAESNPTIKDLVDQMNNSILDFQRKIAMVNILLKEEEKIVTS